MTNVHQILSVAGVFEPHPDRSESYLLLIPVRVIHLNTRQIFHADMVDVKGLFPGGVHLVEANVWRSASQFALAPDFESAGV